MLDTFQVRKGLFGLGSLEGDQPVCRYFKEKPYVGLAGSEIIIRAEVCHAQIEAAKSETVVYPEPTDTGAGLGEGGPSGIDITPPITGAGGVTRVVGPSRRSLRLGFDVPQGKVSGLMGVLHLLQHRFKRLGLVVSADRGEISEQEYEDKIEEAFRQMGIEVREE